MDPLGDEGFAARTAIGANQSGLAGLALINGVIGLLWLWLGIAGLLIRGLTNWIIFPIGLIGAAAFGSICFWALRRRANPETALIIDGGGIFDNVSMVRAGRVKWSEMERVWISGPGWLQVLCILPDNVMDYMSKQDEVRGTVMRLNFALRRAPIIVPMVALKSPVDEVWRTIEKVAGAPRLRRPTKSRFVAGA
jgi:hypothetical protein